MNLEYLVTGEVFCCNERFTSYDLINGVSAIKRKLQSYICINNEIIALVLPRNFFVISTVFALLDLGVEFLPIEMDTPELRKKYILQNANIKKVITVREHEAFFKDEYDCIIVDGDESQVGDYESFPKNKNAYILFTSGTTGMPKAVEVTRKNLFSFFEGFSSAVKMKENTTILCSSSYTFDIFLVESVLALLNGLNVVLATERERKNPYSISKLLVNNKVDIIQMTPSHLEMVRAYDSELSCLRDVSKILLGGEKLSESLLKILQMKTKSQIFNLYGTTETTVWNTCANLSQCDEITIGHEIDGCKIYILDDELNLVEDGDIGQICISGAGVSRGYLHDEIKTQKKFVSALDGIRVYLTGDRGYVNKEGNLVCLGRIDNQIKIRGNRIELEDVEENIKKMPQIINAAVGIWKECDVNKMICFYQSNNIVVIEEFVDYLKKRITDYMIPSVYVKVEKFKYLASGKIDRKEMVRNYQRKQQDFAYPVDFESMKNISKCVFRVVCDKMNAELDIEKDVSSNLYDRGLDSITYIKIIVELEKDFPVYFNEDFMVDVESTTIEKITQYIITNVSRGD